MAETGALARYNPYAPGPATPPPVLAGRDQWSTELVEYLHAAEQGRPTRTLVFSGLRGVGKTVLLGELRQRARDRRWAAERFEAQPGSRLTQAIAAHAGELLADLPGRAPARGTRWRDLVQAVTVSVDSSGTVSAGMSAGRQPMEAGERLLQASVRDLFVELGRAGRQRGVGVALLLDEFQDASVLDVRAVALGIQAVAADRLPLVVVAAGLPTLAAHVKAAVSYAERFQFAELGYLSGRDAARALAEPASEQGVRFEPRALQRLVDASEGYPFLLQLYGRHAWAAAVPAISGPIDDGEAGADEAAGDTITLVHAEAAEASVWRELNLGVFGGRWSQATNSERRYLMAMAVLGDGPVRSGDVARTLATTTQAVSQYRQRLIDKGLIFGAEDRTVAFTLPRFARYVRERARDDALELVAPGSVLAGRVAALGPEPEPGRR